MPGKVMGARGMKNDLAEDGVSQKASRKENIYQDGSEYIEWQGEY